MSRGGRGFRKDTQELHPANENQNEHNIFTAEVEDDCGALDNKTFEGSLDVTGVDVHAKVAELEDHNQHFLNYSSPADSLDDEDSLSFQEVVQRSISHLGLDDDQDEDPAIGTHSKATASPWPARWGRPRSSPPPPVFLPQRSDGSPMMETIWTPKPMPPSTPNDQLKSLLWKLQHQQQPQRTQEHGFPEHHPPERSFLPPNARTLEDVEREMLNSASSLPVSTGSPRAESPSVSEETRAERLEGGDFVGPSPQPSNLSGATPKKGATTPAKSGSVDHAHGVRPGPPFSGQPRTPLFRFSPGSSAYPPCTQPGPVLPAPVGVSPTHGQIPRPANEFIPPGTHPYRFSDRMPPSDLTLGHALSGRVPLAINLPNFQPGTSQGGIIELQNTGSSPPKQQPSYQTMFGNPALFGMPHTGFGNRMPLPPVPLPTPDPRRFMMYPDSPMSLNDPAIRGPMSLPSNLSGFQPGINQVRFQPQNTGSIPQSQQPAYQTVFGNQGGATFRSPPPGFGNTMPLPTTPNPMLSPGLAMMPPYSSTSLNAPAIPGPMPLPSNLPGFQPGMNQLRFVTQNSGNSQPYQHHAYHNVFGNYGGTTFGSQLQIGGGVQQQVRHPYPRTPFPGGTLDHRDRSNGSFHPGSNVPAIVTRGS